MFFGPLFMIGGPILIIVLLIVLTRWLTDSRNTRVRLRTPREILDERFARGEIDREDYVTRRKNLEA